jgi:N-methylhydantoinase B
LNGKVSARVDAGEAYIIRGGGGGGLGLPRERSLDALKNDVRQGYVTRGGVEKFYGVKN